MAEPGKTRRKDKKKGERLGETVEEVKVKRQVLTEFELEVLGMTAEDVGFLTAEEILTLKREARCREEFRDLGKEKGIVGEELEQFIEELKKQIEEIEMEKLKAEIEGIEAIMREVERMDAETRAIQLRNQKIDQVKVSYGEETTIVTTGEATRPSAVGMIDDSLEAPLEESGVLQELGDEIKFLGGQDEVTSECVDKENSPLDLKRLSPSKIPTVAVEMPDYEMPKLDIQFGFDFDFDFDSGGSDNDSAEVSYPSLSPCSVIIDHLSETTKPSVDLSGQSSVLFSPSGQEQCLSSSTTETSLTGPPVFSDLICTTPIALEVQSEVSEFVSLSVSPSEYESSALIEPLSTTQSHSFVQTSKPDRFSCHDYPATNSYTFATFSCEFRKAALVSNDVLDAEQIFSHTAATSEPAVSCRDQLEVRAPVVFAKTFQNKLWSVNQPRYSKRKGRCTGKVFDDVTGTVTAAADEAARLTNSFDFIFLSPSTSLVTALRNSNDVYDGGTTFLRSPDKRDVGVGAVCIPTYTTVVIDTGQNTGIFMTAMILMFKFRRKVGYFSRCGIHAIPAEGDNFEFEICI